MSENGYSHFTEAEIHAGLSALVLCSGNSRRAAKLLRDSGQRAIAYSTLHKWATDQYAGRYRELQDQLRPELVSRLAEDHDALVQSYSELQWDAIEQARKKLPDAKAGEAANIAKNAALGAAINTDKGQLRRGEPTSISESRDFPEMLRAAAAQFPSFFNLPPSWKGKLRRYPTPQLGRGKLTETEPIRGSQGVGRARTLSPCLPYSPKGQEPKPDPCLTHSPAGQSETQKGN